MKERGIVTSPINDSSKGSFGRYKFLISGILISIIFTFFNCKKEVNQMEFLELITKPAHTISQTRAKVECVVINGVGDVKVDYGICWSANPKPTIDSTKSYWSQTKNEEGFSSTLRNLKSGTTYYARAYAANDGHAIYGNEISFQTQIGTIGKVSDSDGNLYNTVIIGEQIWMAENLRTTKYRNGDLIEEVNNQSEWNNQTSGAYCQYNNDTINAHKYGNLYNWYAVDDSRGLAPEGWHVATDADWFALMNYWTELTNGPYVANKLKEKGKTHWKDCNNSSSNESGFTALPGGKIDESGFHGISWNGNWWTSSYYYPYYPYSWSMSCSWTIDRESNKKTFGYSVRCVKD